jgi:hypothetical protein
MSNSLIITLSTAGMALLICSCATSPTEKEKGEFPLVQTGEIKEDPPVQPSMTLPQEDPFRSPDVTRSLPGSSPAFRAPRKPVAPRPPVVSPITQPAPSSTLPDTEE